MLAIDIVPRKLALARELGATNCLDAGRDNVVAAIRDITRGGVQHAIESVGSESVFAQAYVATRRGGTTITVGLPAPQRMFSVPAVTLVAEECTVKGSSMGSAVPSCDIPRCSALYRAGRLPVDPLLTHRLSGLDDVNTGFDRLARGESIRQAIVF